RRLAEERAHRVPQGRAAARRALLADRHRGSGQERARLPHRLLPRRVPDARAWHLLRGPVEGQGLRPPDPAPGTAGLPRAPRPFHGRGTPLARTARLAGPAPEVRRTSCTE